MALLLAEEGIDSIEKFLSFLFLSISTHLCAFPLSSNTRGTAAHASLYRYLSRSALSKSTPTLSYSLPLSLAWTTLPHATCHPVTGNPKHPCVYASWSIDCLFVVIPYIRRGQPHKHNHSCRTCFILKLELRNLLWLPSLSL